MTTLANGATILDTDTHFAFLVDNSSATPTVFLPHASSGAGKQIRFQATVPWNGHVLIIRTQGSDGIWDTTNSAVTIDNTHQGGVTYVSDGGSRWLVLWTD